MRKIYGFAVLFVCFCCGNSYSQDLIVTNVGDSISCKIIDQNAEVIHFSYNRYNHITVRELTMSRVHSVVPGFYNQRDNRMPLRDSVRLVISPPPPVEGLDSIPFLQDDNLKKWSFGIHGGYAYRLERARIKATPYELKYFESLKPGLALGADLFYFPWKRIGFGLRYDVYKTRGERDFRTRDNITIQFLGGSIAHRTILKNATTSILSSFWIGYQPYRNSARFLSQDYLLKANTMGWGFSVGVEQKVGSQLAISLSGSCFIGSAFRFEKKIEGRYERIIFPENEFKDLSRAELTLGLRLLR